MLYLPHSMVHVPLHVSDKFRGKSQRGLFGDVVMEIDWSVGQILDALRKHKLDKNTLVIFTSDNGPWLSYGDHAGSAGPLREGKGTMFDGGCREPTVMWWPGKIPAGTVCRTPAMTIDILPDDRPPGRCQAAGPPDRRQEHLAAGGRPARRQEPARSLLLLLGQPVAGGPHGPVEAALPARLSDAGRPARRQGRPARALPAGQDRPGPVRPGKRPGRDARTSPSSIPTWRRRSRAWPTGCARSWATRPPSQKGSGVREPGRLEAGDLRFDWKPGQPLQVEAQ